MKNYLSFKTKWVLWLSLLVFVIFFGRLFLPRPQLFYTPDFGRSDIWHFNYPIKDFLASSLKKGRLPFWSSQVGTGFPFLAESQIGALNLSNLILFFFLPTWLAWNLSFVIIFLTGFGGAYFFLKKNKLSQTASFLGGFIFSFSGFFICHISHFNLIQTASFLPWLFLTSQNLFQKRSKKNVFFLAFIFSQQIFSGHPQMAFINLTAIGSFIVFQLLQLKDKKKALIHLKPLLLALILGLCLAGPQLLPTIKLTQLSSRKEGMSDKVIFQYPYPPQHLLSFIWPNFFGTPQNASYPAFRSGQWGIYWENTAYLGILPLILTGLAIFKRKRSALEKFFFFLLVFSLLLVLGKDSPLYFLFAFPGFSFFRVPSRFLLVTVFAFGVLAALGFDQLKTILKRKLKNQKNLFAILCLLIFICIFDLFHFGFNYHPLITKNEALKPPQTASLITPLDRVYTDLSQGKIWNNVFLETGWQKIKPFLFFKNSLGADLNLLFNLANIEAFYGLPPARQEYYQQQLSRKLIDAASAQYLILTEKVAAAEKEGLILIDSVTPDEANLSPYFIYQNTQALPRFRFASHYQISQTVDEFIKQVNQSDFNLTDTVILEENPDCQLEKLTIAEIKIITEEENHLLLKTETDKKSILVIADSFYPNWQAQIDGQKTKIMPANLNQRAIILPAGQHQVQMDYQPKEFKLGLILAVVAGVIFLLA